MPATRLIVGAAVASIAIAAAGCGGSSTNNKPSNATTSTASSTPATSSTPTTSNTGTAPKSERIDSPAYYNFALKVTQNTASYLNASQANWAAHCIQQHFLAAGFKTQGDVEKSSNASKLRDITTTCFLDAQHH